MLMKIAKLSAIAIAVEIASYVLVFLILTVGTLIGVPLLCFLVVVGAQVLILKYTWDIFVKEKVDSWQ